MKSREGKVVDADDLIEEMISTSRQMANELGKLDEIPAENREQIYSQIGLAALKYFILKVDPKKNMIFNPAESIDFNGNTGPFIQYTYTRIQSVLRKAEELMIANEEVNEINPKEKTLIKLIYDFPSVVRGSADELNPALVANYLYDLAREFNQFYHEHSILNADNDAMKQNRLAISALCGHTIRNGMAMLGIDVPERM
jgi:arginyl-tRNA synthetase